MKSPQKRTSFTLVEMLISIGLVAVLGLVVYSCLNGGLRIWQRANTTHAGEDVSIFFEKLSIDLRNSFPYKGIDFSGVKSGLSFATLVTTGSSSPGLRRGPGEMSYFYSEEDKTIIRQTRNLSTIFKEREGSSREILRGVSECDFLYYYYDPYQDDYFWVQEWQKKSQAPFAVGVRIAMDYDKKRYEFSKKIIIPVR